MSDDNKRWSLEAQAILCEVREAGRKEGVLQGRNLVLAELEKFCAVHGAVTPPVRKVASVLPRNGRKPGPKPRKAVKVRKNPWAGLSKAEKLAKINAMRKGRGLALKASL